MKENVKNKLPVNSPLIKIPFGGLTSNMLRTIAIVLMLSDHTEREVQTLKIL